MRCIRGRVRRWILALYTVSIATAASPAGAESRDILDKDAEIAAGYSLMELYLSDGGARNRTRLRRVGFEYDQHYPGGLVLGLIGGYGTFSQEQGSELAGNFLGVNGRLMLIQSARLQLTVLGRYLYQYLGGDNSPQPRKINWDESGIGLRLGARLGDRWSIAAGERYDWVVADQRTEGTAPGTVTLKPDEHASTFIEVAVEIDAGGFVGVLMQRGMMDVNEIMFRRVF